MPSFFIENTFLIKGFNVIAGIDEAGRGSWAGPVVAAAVVLDRTTLCPALAYTLNDSKKLSSGRREELLVALKEYADICVAIATVAEIDASNILDATKLAMRRTIEGLAQKPDVVLIDGNHKPAINCPAYCIIKGDEKCISIAAASIVAKVSRDNIMKGLSSFFPGYGWESNAGYGTEKHKISLYRLGITTEHRRSFKPIRKILGLESTQPQHI